jgi:hypothetical protein
MTPRERCRLTAPRAAIKALRLRRVANSELEAQPAAVQGAALRSESFQVKPDMADTAAAFAPIDRSDLRRAYRLEEEACIAERLDQAAPAARVHGAAASLAIDLIEGARAHKASGIDAFLQQYGLDTEEGIALMCLAEALLRVPDAATADALIRDKIGAIDWSEHLGESSSTFVNAATFSLMLTGEVLDPPEATRGTPQSVVVDLVGGTRLSGRVERIDAATVALALPWGESIAFACQHLHQGQQQSKTEEVGPRVQSGPTSQTLGVPGVCVGPCSLID